MRLTVEVDSELLRLATERSGLTTRKALVEAALRLLAQSPPEAAIDVLTLAVPAPSSGRDRPTLSDPGVRVFER